MPLTIEQALKELPILSTAKVVAGEQNLDHVIRWTHIIDHPDIVPWVQEDYLLLTTAFSLMLNPDSQNDLIPHLVEKKLAGMMVNVGRYMGEIPSNMVSIAKRLKFPLISLPWEINFTDVTHAIHERIINEQYEISEQVFHIHEVLTQIVIEGGGLDTLVSQLANLLHRSITLEDTTFSLLAYKSFEPVDSVRERSIKEGRTPTEIIAFHTQQGLYDRLYKERRPQRVEPVPELGLTLERVIAPIIVGSHLFGYIWVIATDRPLTELDFLAIERGAIVAALIMSREQAVYEAEQRVKNQLFENLLDPQSSKDHVDLAEILRKMGFYSGYRILVVENCGNQPLIVQTRIVEYCTNVENVNALIMERNGRLVVILSSNSRQKVCDITARIINRGNNDHCSFSIGISSQVSNVKQFREAYEEALHTLRIGKAVSPQGGYWFYENLGYIVGLLNLPEEFHRANYYQSMISTLKAYDEKHNAHLVNTLNVYIDQLADIQQTARVLFIHRNTLYQRLEKINNLCQINLQDIITIINLYLAIKSRNILNNSSSL